MNKLLVLTACFHYDDKPVFRLRQSCEAFGIDFSYYGLKEVFHNWRQAKIERLAEVLNQIDDEYYSHLLFTDGFDSFMLRSEKETIEEFEKLNAPVVVSSEINCSPIGSLANVYPPCPTPFRFVCGGQFMGRTKDVRALINGMNKHFANYHRPDFQNGNDQIDWTYAYLENFMGLKLDTECRLFLSTCGVPEDWFEWEDKKLLVKPTKSYPCAIHFNGPKGGTEHSQVYMDRLWAEFGIKWNI